MNYQKFRPDIPFDLAELPPDLKLQEHPSFMDFMNLHNEAQKNISELNGSLREIENPDLLLSSFYLHESISSSAVENIHTTIESALEDETKPEQERSEVGSKGANNNVSRYNMGNNSSILSSRNMVSSKFSNMFSNMVSSKFKSTVSRKVSQRQTVRNR
jgi:Fic family protein